MHLRLGLTALLTAALVAAVPTTASAATNLGALWHLDESSGATAVDSSGNANNGALNGAPARIAGRFGGALRFDGIDDNVFIARSATLEPATVTVEGWVRRGSSPGQFRHIVSQGAYLCEVASYGLTTGAGGGIGFYVSNGSDEHVALSTEAAPEAIWDGAWHHVAGTYDGTAVRLYVDGAEVGNGTAATIPIGYGLPNPAGLIGAFGGTCSLNWAGDLDAPRIWRRALSSTELAAGAAMGSPTTTQLDERVDSAQAIVHSDGFSDGDDVTISIASATGTEKIKSVRIVGLLPLTSRATCNRGLLSALLSSSCDVSLSNGGRTAKLDVRPILGTPVVALRVTVTSGRTFDVSVDTSGSGSGLSVEAEASVSIGT